jgi:hypothetical protein
MGGGRVGKVILLSRYRWRRGWGESKYVKLLYVPAEYIVQNTECRIQNTKYRIQNIEYRVHNTETDVHKITNVPVFLYGALTYGPNGTRFAGCHFRAQKSLDFQSPPLPIALVMGVARIKIMSFAIYCKHQVH